MLICSFVNRAIPYFLIIWHILVIIFLYPAWSIFKMIGKAFFTLFVSGGSLTIFTTLFFLLPLEALE